MERTTRSCVGSKADIRQHEELSVVEIGLKHLVAFHQIPPSLQETAPTVLLKLPSPPGGRLGVGCGLWIQPVNATL
jgi:hypothetical protein